MRKQEVLFKKEVENLRKELREREEKWEREGEKN